MRSTLLCFRLVLLATFVLSLPASADVVLAKNEKSDWQIYSSSTNAAAKFAAGELQKYFLQLSGASLPIAKKERSKKTIVLSLRSDLSKQSQALVPPAAKGFDGYAIIISQKPEQIIIAGENTSGLIYGVYDLLEKLGCRWFYPNLDANDREVVPRLKLASLPANSWAVASPIRHRICNGSAWYFQMDYAIAKKQVDWAMKNRYNAIGWQAAVAGDKKSLLQQYQELESFGVLDELRKRDMFIHGPAHAFDHFLPTEPHFKGHPEWFGLRDGKRVPQTALGAQFCWSNAEARKEFARNAAAFATNAPLIKIFCAIPFDGGIACGCDDCKKAGSSNLLMIVLAELIEKLKATSPGLMVETVGGYGAVPDPPSNLDVIHPEQRVVWAQWGRHHGRGYDDPKYDVKNLDNWRKAAKGGLTICQYYTDNFAEPWVMGPFTVAMESDRRYFLKHKVDALYMLMYPVGYWWNHSLNGYLSGRCFYDVSLDPLTDLRDYSTNYFGPNAGPLLGDYYTEWAKNIDLSYRVRGDSRKQDRAMLKEQRRKFIDPAVNAAKGDKLFSYRVAKVEQLHALAEILTETHRQRDLVLIMRQQGKFEEASRLMERARGQTEKAMARLYAVSDPVQGLMDRKEVSGFIKTVLHKWFDEETKAIAAKDTKIAPNPWKNLAETEFLPEDGIPAER